MDFDALRTLPGTTQEEFDRIKEGILVMATSTEPPEEYTDEATSIRLTVERDAPYKDNPRITVFAPEHCTLPTEEMNAAIHRLLAQAGITPPEQPGQAAQGGKL